MENNFIPDGWKPRLQDLSAFMGARVRVLRLDEIHPVVSGNKWFKLKGAIAAAVAGGFESIVTFGGAYSNHLVAAAAVAKQYGLKSVGVVRGEAQYAKNPTLTSCAAYGMDLHFVSREAYRDKTAPHFVKDLLPGLTNYYLIPEGGAGPDGMLGVAEIAKWLPGDATHIALSVGTGTTLAGIYKASPCRIFLGFCATKDCHEQATAVAELTDNKEGGITFYKDEHFGGFGKWSDALTSFLKDFFAQTGIPLDVVYTGKMMYALRQLIEAGSFPADANIVCIHTGGLQGNPAGLFGA